MGKFRITGSVEMDVTLEVEADGEADARQSFEMMIWCLESGDDSIKITSAEENSSSIEEVESLQEEKWGTMSHGEKVEFLVSQGEDGDEACRMIGDEDNYGESLHHHIQNLEL